MPSLHNGEYQAVALAVPRTCKAQSIAKMDSPAFFLYNYYNN
jgi:hypothetical protein